MHKQKEVLETISKGGYYYMFYRIGSQINLCVYLPIKKLISYKIENPISTISIRYQRKIITRYTIFQFSDGGGTIICRSKETYINTKNFLKSGRADVFIYDMK